MINKILYTNLDRRPDRNEWFLSNMEGAGVPMDLVERISSKDWQDYPNVKVQLEAMKSDGFGANIDPSHPTVYHPKNRGSYACMWSFCIALGKSIDTDFVLVMQEDVSLNVEWTALLDAVEEAVNSVDGLWVIQLESTGFSPDKHHTLRPIIADAPAWRSGIGSLGDKAVVYHSWGSRLLLNICKVLTIGYRDQNKRSIIFSIIDTPHTQLIVISLLNTIRTAGNRTLIFRQTLR